MLTEAVKYCHVRGVQAHLTLNTLVSDKETADLTKEVLVSRLSKTGGTPYYCTDVQVELTPRSDPLPGQCVLLFPGQNHGERSFKRLRRYPL